MGDNQEMQAYTSEGPMIKPISEGMARSPSGIALLVAVALVTLACGAPNSTLSGSPDAAAAPSTGRNADIPSQSATQASEEGEVTVTVTWRGVSAGPVFVVAMDTHSIDLDSYDLKDLAVLKINAGQGLRPIAWDAPKGGHHRSGALVFPATPADGGLSIDPDALTMTLVIRDVAGVPERIFQWTL